MQSLESLSQSASPAVLGAIKQASAESGVDFSYLLRKAATESSLNPEAKAATSSASGLYQFIDQTWLTEMAQHGAQYGLGQEASSIYIDSAGHASVSDPSARREIMALKDDPKVAAEMAAAFTKDNQAYLQANVGGHIGGTELYLAHFLGAGGAAKFLNALRANPGQSAPALFPAAADANEPVFFHADGAPRSLGDVYSRFAAKFSGTGTGPETGPVDAVAQSATGNWQSRFYAPFTAATGTSGAGASGAGELDGNDAIGNESRASLYQMMILSQLSGMHTFDSQMSSGDSQTFSGKRAQNTNT